MSNTAISLQGVEKYYKTYEKELDRLKEIVTGKPCHEKQFALHALDLEVKQGEVLGVIGKNGAGKSTLLKIVANTLQPSAGTLTVNGRVAALLELGASFHPEMTGRENIFLSCSIQGLSKADTEARYEEIVEYSGIREFINKPVKTYSSGMFVRLAFSIATHIDPEILIIDEALSVGDGVFARKSFDRIMAFKKAGKTILFCSHSMYQVEALCDRVIWLERGKLKGQGEPATVVTEYSETMRMESPLHENMATNLSLDESDFENAAKLNPQESEAKQKKESLPFVKNIVVTVNDQPGKAHAVQSGEDDVKVSVQFDPGKNVALPTVGIAISGGDGRILASCGTLNDGVKVALDESGMGNVELLFNKLPLLKGNYNIDVFLMCERGVLVYEAVIQAAELNVKQRSLERGLVTLPHKWL